jgi:hypothetical protein
MLVGAAIGRSANEELERKQPCLNRSVIPHFLERLRKISQDSQNPDRDSKSASPVEILMVTATPTRSVFETVRRQTLRCLAANELEMM